MAGLFPDRIYICTYTYVYAYVVIFYLCGGIYFHLHDVVYIKCVYDAVHNFLLSLHLDTKFYRTFTKDIHYGQEASI